LSGIPLPGTTQNPRATVEFLAQFPISLLPAPGYKVMRDGYSAKKTIAPAKKRANRYELEF
jgi:hypothetical protein